jgi:hypothetical protein
MGQRILYEVAKRNGKGKNLILLMKTGCAPWLCARREYILRAQRRDCPLINRFEVLLKEDEEGEPDHMRGF